MSIGHIFILLALINGRGIVPKYVLYLKLHRIDYIGIVTEYTNLYIFCDTCLLWDFHYAIFKDTCFRVYIQRCLVFKYIDWHFLYQETSVLCCAQKKNYVDLKQSHLTKLKLWYTKHDQPVYFWGLRGPSGDATLSTS